METKTIKFNINNFIEDFSYAVESKDYEWKENLIRSFNKVYTSSSTSIQNGIKLYISKHSVAMQYPDLKELAGKN